MAVYFGGSRHLVSPSPIIGQVVSRVIGRGGCVHVGCQRGADQQVSQVAAAWQSLLISSSLVVFAVAPSLAVAPAHVQSASARGARVVLGAGGSSAPMPARYLLRSIAAFQGCSQAVFFQPGPGSLAVARECVKSGVSVFAFGSYPAQVPSCVGFWVESSFQGFPCWQWQATASQPGLF